MSEGVTDAVGAMRAGLTWMPTVDQTDVYQTNNLNQYTQVATNVFSHDAHGNRTADWKGAYTYDGENRLHKAVMNSANPMGALTADYTYDPMGRRLSKVVSGQGTTEYLLDGDHEIAEYDGAGNPLRRFVYGPYVDKLIAMQDVATGDYSYVHQNRQGSTIAISNDSGVVPTGEEYRYEGYGAPDHSGAFPFQYAGRRYDPETGFYYYRARMYDSDSGRFMQVDPIGYYDQINLYAYTYNDPVNNTDPTGEVVNFVVHAAIRCGLSAACRGAVVGIATEGASQIGKGEFNAKRLVVAGVSGAATGGLSSKSKLAQIVGDRAISTADAVAMELADGGDFTDAAISGGAALTASTVSTNLSAGVADPIISSASPKAKGLVRSLANRATSEVGQFFGDTIQKGYDKRKSGDESQEGGQSHIRQYPYNEVICKGIDDWSCGGSGIPR